MNVHNNNSDLLSDNLLFKFNEYFNLYSHRSKISIKDLIVLVEKEFGYHPTQDEIHDLYILKLKDIYFYIVTSPSPKLLSGFKRSKALSYFKTLMDTKI